MLSHNDRGARSLIMVHYVKPLGQSKNPCTTFLQSIIVLIWQIGEIFDVGPFEGPYVPESQTSWKAELTLLSHFLGCDSITGLHETGSDGMDMNWCTFLSEVSQWYYCVTLYREYIIGLLTCWRRVLIWSAFPELCFVSRVLTLVPGWKYMRQMTVNQWVEYYEKDK